MWIDILFVILLVAGIIRGWKQGIIISVFSTLAWVIGVIGALKLSAVAAAFMQEQFDIHSRYSPVIAFVAMFAIIALVIYLIGKSLEQVVEIAHLGFINKIMGAAVRAAIFTFIFSIFLWLINQAGLISSEVKAQSKTYSFLGPLSQMIIDKCTAYLPFAKTILDELKQFFQNLSQQIPTSV